MNDVSKNQRRLQLTIEEIELIVASLQMLTVKPAVDLAARLKGIVQEEQDPAFRAQRDAYRNALPVSDACEIDGDAEVSFGDDAGAYVMAWIWVTDRQAGICPNNSGD